MISTKFVHACDDVYMIESAYEDNARTINSLTGTLNILSQQRKDLKMFGIFTEAKEEYFEESVSTVVEKLGQKILDIIQKFKEFMDDLFRKWKERSWQKKDDVQKLREIEKKDPKVAAKLEAHIKAGDIDLKSYKDINDFFSKCDDVLKNIEKNNVDPKSLKGKLNKAKDALNDKKGAIAAVATALGLVATTAGLAVTYQRYKQGCSNKILREGENIRAEADIRMKKINVELVKLQEMQKSGVSHNGSKISILAELANEVDNVSRVQVNNRLNLARKFESQFASGARGALSKISRSKISTDDSKIYADEIKKRTDEFKRLKKVVNASPNGNFGQKDT